MLSSYGVISLLALATASTASPISAARRDSSLIPTPPPACLALASNATSVSNTTNVTDTSSLSNVTGGASTTTTCIIPASDLPSSLNGTDLSNVTSISNCTSLTNSTSTNTTGSSDNSTTTPSSTDTATATSSADTSTDTSSADTSTDTGSTDDTSTDTSSADTSTATSTSSSTSDSSTLPTDTSSSAPPASTAPPPSGGEGSSGTPDPTTGQFTADTGDPAGRRKRSTLAALFDSLRPRRHRNTLVHHRRIAQTDLPTVAQNWQDLCLASGGDIFTNDPCVNLAGIAGINALLSTGGACDQQDNADNMIDFAKSPGVTNEAALIAAAIAYRQHPRNADDMGEGIVPSTPYCTKQPRNQELVGIVNEQLPGVNPGLFGGPNSPIVAFGADGTCPAGQSPDVSTCSCA